MQISSGSLTASAASSTVARSHKDFFAGYNPRTLPPLGLGVAHSGHDALPTQTPLPLATGQPGLGVAYQLHPGALCASCCSKASIAVPTEVLDFNKPLNLEIKAQ